MNQVILFFAQHSGEHSLCKTYPGNIRAFQIADLEQVMQIWLDGNREAHPFIPDSYWEENFA